VAAGLDALAFVSDPVSSLLQYGISWLIEHVRPLTEALEWLAGDPAAIAGHAQTWRNIAMTVRAEGLALADAVQADIVDWHGPAAEAYRAWSREQQGALAALATAGDTMGLITESAGFLIAGVRTLVRDAIAIAVSRIIVYAVELIASGLLATPLVIEQVTTTVAACAGRIARWLKPLIASLRNLIPVAGRLGQRIDELEAILERLSKGPGEAVAGVPPVVRTPAKLDPDMVTIRPAEQATAARLADDPRFDGRTFHASPRPDPGYDWVDDLGRTYDSLGDGTKAQYLKIEQFIRQIDKHLLKRNTFTVVDLTGYRPDQIGPIKAYVDSLPVEVQSEIVRVGF
jgi:hypothetical protein